MIIFFTAIISLAGIIVVVSDDKKWLAFFICSFALAAFAYVYKRKTDIWLFLLCGLTSFNFGKYLSEGVSSYYIPDQFVIYAIDVPITLLILSLMVSSQSSVTRQPPFLDWRVRLAGLIGLTFCIWALMLGIFAAIPKLAILESIRYARLFLVFLIICLSIRDRRSVIACLTGLLTGLLAQSTIAILQFIFGSSFGFYEAVSGVTAGNLMVRAGGTLNPTVLSEYIGAIIPFALVLTYFSKKSTVMWLSLAIYIIAATASLLAFSRGGWINLTISMVLVIMLFYTNKNLFKVYLNKFIVITLVIFVMLFGLVWVQYESILSRFSVLSQSGEGRLDQVQFALDKSRENLMGGVGLGNYMEVIGNVKTELDYPVHNKFIIILAETGAIGLSLYLLFWFLLCSAAYGSIKRLDSFEAGVAIGALAALIGTFVNMQTDVYALGGAPELSIFAIGGIIGAITKESYNI